MESYIIILLIELFVIIIYKIFSKKQFKKFKNIKISLIIVLIFYIILNIMVKGSSMYLKYKVNTFDLDGDGMFSGAEITPEQEMYFNQLINDTGRNFFPIIFGIFSIKIFFILIIIGKIFDIIIKKFRDNKIRANCT